MRQIEGDSFAEVKNNYACELSEPLRLEDGTDYLHIAEKFIVSSHTIDLWTSTNVGGW
jgi:hypothetical protein